MASQPPCEEPTEPGTLTGTITHTKTDEHELPGYSSHSLFAEVRLDMRLQEVEPGVYEDAGGTASFEYRLSTVEQEQDTTGPCTVAWDITGTTPSGSPEPLTGSRLRLDDPVILGSLTYRQVGTKTTDCADEESGTSETEAT